MMTPTTNYPTIHEFLDMNQDKYFIRYERSLEHLLNRYRFEEVGNQVFFENVKTILSAVKQRMDFSQENSFDTAEHNLIARKHLYLPAQSAPELQEKYQALLLNYDTFPLFTGDGHRIFYTGSFSGGEWMQVSFETDVPSLTLRFSKKKHDIRLVLSTFYFIELAKLNGHTKIELNDLSGVEENDSTESVLLSLGFQKTSAGYVLQLDTKTMQLVDRAVEMMMVRDELKLTNPEIILNPTYSNEAKSPYFSPNVPGGLYFDFKWFGYDGYLVLYEQGDVFILEESGSNMLIPVTVESRVIHSDERLIDVFHELMGSLKEQMKLPNLIDPPAHCLTLLVNDFADTVFKQGRELMEMFLEKGYSYEDVETEAATLWGDNEYKQNRSVKPRVHQITIEVPVRNEILEFLDHYLVFSRYPSVDFVDFAVVDTEEEAKDRMEHLFDKYQTDDTY